MQRLLIWVLDRYKRWLSPWLPSACRFHPTCSVYARQAVERYGAARGCWMALRRLSRCHPFHPGGFDPVPERLDRRSREQPGQAAGLARSNHNHESAPSGV